MHVIVLYVPGTSSMKENGMSGEQLGKSLKKQSRLILLSRVSVRYDL